MAATLLPKRVAIVDWIKLVTTFAADHVIKDQQNFPRPATKPYVSYKIALFDPLNQAYTTPPNVLGEAVQSRDVEFVCNLHCYGDGNQKTAATIDPMEIMLNLHASLDNLAQYKVLKDAGVIFVDDLLGPTDTSTKLNGVWEPRASMDLLLRMVWDTLDTGQGVIESTEIQATYKNAGDLVTIVHQETINIDSTP